MGGENYEGKTALILGGGDGGLLCELLKQNPKFVTMVEVRFMGLGGGEVYGVEVRRKGGGRVTGIGLK